MSILKGKQPGKIKASFLHETKLMDSVRLDSTIRTRQVLQSAVIDPMSIDSRPRLRPADPHCRSFIRELDSKTSHNSHCQKDDKLVPFLKTLERQVELDRVFREHKRTLSSICAGNQGVWLDLQLEFKRRGLTGMTKSSLLTMFTLSPEEYNPLAETNRDFSADRMVDSYLQAEAHFTQSVKHSLSVLEFGLLKEKLRCGEEVPL
jgi:hypothetical protein